MIIMTMGLGKGRYYHTYADRLPCKLIEAAGRFPDRKLVKNASESDVVRTQLAGVGRKIMNFEANLGFKVIICLNNYKNYAHLGGGGTLL